MRRSVLAVLSVLIAGGAIAAEQTKELALNLRSRVQPFKGVDQWNEVTLTQRLPGRETALIICDMWDKHWCESATTRGEAIAKKMEPVLAAARARGVTIIHAPSECMDFYKDAPQRLKVKELPKVELLKPLTLNDPPLLCDSSDGGCDDATPKKSYKAWTRETPLLTIGADDFITDKGEEVYQILKHRNIKTLFVCGVHTNMCVLNRSFAIRQMTRWGVRCILIRDLTDSMYSPKLSPFVSHDEGTALIIEHIEKYWCPSILSSDLLGK